MLDNMLNQMMSQAGDKALSNIRVLDLSRILAGPWCTQNLADLGADVIKVERPGVGDDTRVWGPPWLPVSDETDATDSSYYAAANRGKRSVTVDITTEQGQLLIKRLAMMSDVFIENFKVGNLKKYGLDYESIRRENPSIIYCSITGFGQDGPYSHRPGYDFVFQGMGGMMSITGEKDGSPGGGPQKVGIALADIITGMYSTIAILAAVNHRAKSGEGQYIDMSLLDSVVALGSNQITGYFASGKVPVRMGNAHMSLVPYGVYPTHDGHIIIAVGNDDQWQRYCVVMARDDLAADPDFAKVTGRIVNRERLDVALKATMQTRDSATWLDLLEKSGVPCGPINTYDQVFDNEQVKHRELRVDYEREDGARVSAAASPLRLTATPPTYDLPPPMIGQHTDEILGGLLGLNDQELTALRNAAVI
ncbi:CaiB/BaiF CoA transferase family protein [Bordetella tumulicola]|uniref:CaiB/BaiF CoA transferase family protein n=1 Tax=Bordetella tumulicola TaxID=1649133 RepID=UPI0039EEEAC2